MTKHNVAHYIWGFSQVNKAIKVSLCEEMKREIEKKLLGEHSSCLFPHNEFYDFPMGLKDSVDPIICH